MKLNKSKHQQSIELDEKVQDFLRNGGEVKTIPNGLSGNTSNMNLFKNATPLGPKAGRTPLTEVVKTLENRKNASKQTTPKIIAKPRKKVIVDDFGDPIRWVWEE